MKIAPSALENWRCVLDKSLTENSNGKIPKGENQSCFSTTNVTEMATSPPKMETTISSSKIHQSYLHSNWQLQTQGYNAITYNWKRRVMLWYVMNVPSSAALKVIPVTSWWNIHIQCLMLLAISWRLVPIGDISIVNRQPYCSRASAPTTTSLVDWNPVTRRPPLCSSRWSTNPMANLTASPCNN